MTGSTRLRDFIFAISCLRVDGAAVDPPADIDWAALLNHADGHTLTQLLYSAWRDTGFIDKIPPVFRSRLEAAYRDNGRRQVGVRSELLEVDQLLEEAGVPRIVLKGWPLLERLYTDPAHRLLRDHDFLVPADALGRGFEALLAAGFRPLPGDDSAVNKHARPVWRNDGYPWNGYLFDPDYPRPVELHTRLWDTNWRGLEVQELPDLWHDRQRVTAAGAPMSVLSDEKTVVHLAMHFAGHTIEREPRLSQLLDLARLIDQTRNLDWSKVKDIAHASLHRFLYTSLLLAHKVFGSQLPPEGVWQAFRNATPTPLLNWLEARAYTDALTLDHRLRRKGTDRGPAIGGKGEPDASYDYTGRDYELTFLAARSLAERLGILRFAALPPLEQLRLKYNVRQRWAAPLLYPRHIAERLGEYGRAWLRR